MRPWLESRALAASPQPGLAQGGLDPGLNGGGHGPASPAGRAAQRCVLTPSLMSSLWGRGSCMIPEFLLAMCCPQQSSFIPLGGTCHLCCCRLLLYNRAQSALCYQTHLEDSWGCTFVRGETGKMPLGFGEPDPVQEFYWLWLYYGGTRPTPPGDGAVLNLLLFHFSAQCCNHQCRKEVIPRPLPSLLLKLASCPPPP